MTKFFVSNSKMHGKGLIAAVAIQKGSRVGHIAGKKRRHVSKTRNESLSIPTWFGISKQIWIDPENSAFRYLNHSCEPNAAIIGTKTLVAMRDINEGDEITIDYSMTDADLLWEMRCMCGSRRCRKIIKSIQNIPVAVYRAHLPYVPKYFQRVFLQAHAGTQKQLDSQYRVSLSATITDTASRHSNYVVH